jgi:drug/metabolite transporter (DMT)-like permease
VVFVGIFLVNGTTVGKISLFGLFCAGMSAVLYFFMVTFNKQAKNIVGLENSVIQLVVSFVTVSIFMVIKQGFSLIIPSNAWVWILLLGIVHTGVGCYLYFSKLSKLPAQVVAVCSYIEPLSAVIFATIFLGETMSLLQIIGATCIIGGLALGELVKIKKR